MKPLKLTLKGFIGIRSGLGADEITVDIEALTGDKQLIALKGDNGKGKTTLLDCMHPYRLMPSRASSYTPKAFSYYDHIYGAQAGKELVWEHNGKRYASILIFKQTDKTRKTEAYLQQINPDGTIVPVTANGIVSDGKTDTYDKVLDAILGSPEMFFTSAFSSQGRRQISDYANGEIKSLMSEFLGLDHVLALGAKANDVNKLYKQRLEGLRDDLARAETLKADIQIKQSEISNLKSSLGLLLQSKARYQEALTLAQKKQAIAEADLSKSADIIQKRADLNTQIGQQTELMNQELATVNRDIADHRQKILTITERHNADLKGVSDQIAKINAQIETQQAVLNRREEIQLAASKAKDLAIAGEELQVSIKALREQAAAYQAIEAKRTKLSVAHEAVAKDGKTAKASLDDLIRRASLANDVPCNGTDLQPKCPLLKDALTARDQTATLEQTIAKARADLQVIKDEGTAVAAQMDAMGSPAAKLDEAEARYTATVNQARSLGEVAKLEPSLATAETLSQSLSEQVSDLQASIVDRKARHETDCREIESKLTELVERETTTAARHTARIDTLRKELAALPDPGDLSALDEAKAAVTEATNGLSRAEDEINQAQGKSSELTGQVSALSDQLRRLDSIKEKAAVIESEIALWSQLSSALGNNGIVALSIDDAGPELSRIANDLLLACYGPRFTVSIRTQEEKKDGDMKETFDIVVFDAERGDEKSISTMSGGEKIWINEAITRSIAIFQTQASGQRYDTLFSDESDGALDPERKQMFVKMKREVMRLGNYQQEIFISHTPELWGLADGIIDVATLEKH